MSADLAYQARPFIEALGFKIVRGPYLNTNRVAGGVYIFSIKTVLDAKRLEELGIKPEKDAPADSQRTVRFLGEVEDGKVKGVTHITASERKRKAVQALPHKLRKKIHAQKLRDRKVKKRRVVVPPTT